jgi:hypothetical protein
MPPTNKTRQLIEFKGTTLPVVVVTLRSLHPDALAEAASALFGDDEFFDGDAALLELSQIVDVPEPDWRRVKQVLKSHGLNVIGVRGGSEELRYGAAFAGLPTYAAGERSSPHCHCLPSDSLATARNSRSDPAAPPPMATASAAAPTSSSTGRCVPDNRFTHAAATSSFWPRSMPARKSLPTATSTSTRPCTGAHWPAPAAQPGREFSAPASMPNWFRWRVCTGPSIAASRREMAGKPVQVRLSQNPRCGTGKLIVEPLQTD